MYIITGTVTARPDTFDALLAEGLAHTRRSREEDGCVSHELAIDAENPLRLIFLERWRDQAAIEAHFRVPASGAFVAMIQRDAESATGPDVHQVAAR